jgi:1,4-alpha-glucan branching enzyme
LRQREIRGCLPAFLRSPLPHNGIHIRQDLFAALPSRQSACRLTCAGAPTATWCSADTVTFILRAPHKPFVSLVGDFNGWDTRTHPLHTDGHGSWWTTMPDPGMTRYGFYVIVDDDTHAWVGDPYATQVEWTIKAPWGVLPAPAPPFRWSDRHWRTPALRDLVIYELCVRDAAGTWRGNRPVWQLDSGCSTSSLTWCRRVSTPSS